MNSTINSILERRSIRKYTGERVPEPLKDAILRAGLSAPSSYNSQPWHFVVIDDPNILKEISGIHSGFEMLAESPLAILVCGEPRISKLEHYWEQECAAATENILIAAQAGGLGSVWLGIHPKGGEDNEIIRKVLNIPDYIKPFSLISIGYPAETKEPANRYNENKVHRNNW